MHTVFSVIGDDQKAMEIGALSLRTRAACDYRKIGRKPRDRQFKKQRQLQDDPVF